MDLNYNLLSLVDTVAFIQGITLGVLLILLNRKKYRPTFFLGVFILMFTIEKLPLILEDLSVWDFYPEFYLLPFNHTWVLFPIFFIYCQKVSIFSNEKMVYWPLYPGLLLFIFQSVVFFLPPVMKFELNNTFWFKLVFIAGNLYAIYIALITLKYINDHIKEVGNHFASLEYKELKWAKIFVIFGIAFYASSLLISFVDQKSALVRISLTIVNFVTIYWLSFHGTMQYNVERILSNPNKFGFSLKQLEESDTFLSSKEEQEKLVGKINEYVTNSEAFIHSELTIVELGNHIGVHPRRISSAINSVCNLNFNSYINQFRIKRAMQLLGKKEKLDLSIEGIGAEVGFNSKSAFYSAFKKETGSTPTKFIQKTAVE